MSLIPTVYRSTDPGAPVLSGTAGSFAALMDAVLVNGYGTGPDAKPGLGWVRAFSDGHKRAYQNSLADGGTGMFWRIDDSNAQYTTSAGYHTMTGIDSGVDGFSLSNNAIGKSVTANSTARNWVVIGNSRTVYIFIQSGFTNAGSAYVMYFSGDYECLNKNFLFNFMLAHTGAATLGSSAYSTPLLTSNSGVGTMVAARSYDASTIGVLASTRSSLMAGMTRIGGTAGGGGYPYPYPPTGAMLTCRVCFTVGGYLFGFLPGLWGPEHAGILTRFESYDGIDGSPSSRYLAVESHTGNAVSQALIRTDIPWVY